MGKNNFPNKRNKIKTLARVGIIFMLNTHTPQYIYTMWALAARNLSAATATSQVKVSVKLTMLVRGSFRAWTLPFSQTLESPGGVAHSGIICSCEAMQPGSADVVILWSPLLGLQGVSNRVGIKPRPHGLLLSRTEFCPAVVPLCRWREAAT